MVFIPSALSFLAVAGPTQNSSFTGSGHIFLSISQVNRVWTWSGFWNSEAILASSLLSDTPMFTVKPSSRRISSFTIPLGATINMDGTAIMQGVAVVFASQAFGIRLSVADYLTVILTATLASVGTAGVPGGGLT